MFAAIGGHETVVRALLEARRGVSVNEIVNDRDIDGRTAFIWAAELEDMRELYEHYSKLALVSTWDGCQKALMNGTPLILAAKAGDAKSVELLLKAGVDIKVRNSSLYSSYVGSHVWEMGYCNNAH